MLVKVVLSMETFRLAGKNAKMNKQINNQQRRTNPCMRLITTEVTRYHYEFPRLRAQRNKYVSNTNNISQIALVLRYLTVKCKKIKF